MEPLDPRLNEEVEPFVPTEERFILIGISTAIRQRRITEDEAHEWLDAYIERRWAETRAGMIFIPVTPDGSV